MNSKIDWDFDSNAYGLEIIETTSLPDSETSSVNSPEAVTDTSSTPSNSEEEIVVAAVEVAVERHVTESEELPLQFTAVEKAELTAGPELLQSIDDIPHKMAFKIGEAADIVGVKAYVLRYWESEFDRLRPKKSKNNQRVYSRKDIETALLIKKLLYVDRFSVEGARTALGGLRKEVKEEKEIQALASTTEQAIEGVRELNRRIRLARERLFPCLPRS